MTPGAGRVIGWFVQLVHYPLLDRTPAAAFPEFARAYQRRTFGIVLLPMAVIWLSTAIFQAPQHLALARGFDAELHGRLVRFNWARTAAWTGRSLLLLWIATRMG